ncbi:MAG TPA: hypothetical protein VE198_04825 [Actinoallomurus sp.]|nr:hypothetical protein [Actinoallomurus sp.]
MTSPPDARTRAAEATGAPSGITRRRAVRPPDTTRRPAARTGTPTTPTTAPARRPVRTVERRAATAPQAPFAVLVVGLLGGALVGLLLLNTALAQQSFTRSELQRENQRLDERKQALQEDIARESAPEVLHAKARRLGMRDAGRPASIDPGLPSATPSR